MNNIEILANAFEYIEQHLRDDIKTEDVAEACYCSKSALEKIFRYINHVSVHEYVMKRRMMLAARQITSQPDCNLLEVALSCGYSTNESFTRAFKRIWNCNPSEFRGKSRFSELYPRHYPPIQDGGTNISMHKNVDISELYELFQERKDCYFVCCDIKKMDPINAISRKAGDLAILEAMNRMEKEAGAEDIVFRIGGDEFVMLTNSADIDYAESVCQSIKACNGNCFTYEQQEIPLSLHTTIIKLEGKECRRYRDLFERLHIAIEKNKE